MSAYTGPQPGWAHEARTDRWVLYGRRGQVVGWISSEMIAGVDPAMLAALALERMGSVPPPLEAWA